MRRARSDVLSRSPERDELRCPPSALRETMKKWHRTLLAAFTSLSVFSPTMHVLEAQVSLAAYASEPATTLSEVQNRLNIISLLGKAGQARGVGASYRGATARLERIALATNSVRTAGATMQFQFLADSVGAVSSLRRLSPARDRGGARPRVRSADRSSYRLGDGRSDEGPGQAVAGTPGVGTSWELCGAERSCSSIAAPAPS
jgi:hypothetical protein